MTALSLDPLVIFESLGELFFILLVLWQLDSHVMDGNLAPTYP